MKESGATTTIEKILNFFRRPDLDPVQGVEIANEGPADEKLGQFAPLVEALRSEFEILGDQKVGSHRTVSSEAVCRVSEIRVQPLSGIATTTLKEVLDTYDLPTIKEFLLRVILRNNPHAAYFEFKEFKGIKPVAAPARVDAKKRAIRAALREIGLMAGSEHFIVLIKYKFVKSAPPLRPRGGQRRAADAGPFVANGQWIIEDADGTRNQTIEIRGRESPWRIGRGADCQIHTNATYASAHHANIWFEAGAWWYQDAGSTNGSRIVHSGQVTPLQPSAGHQWHAPVRLETNSTITLCADKQGAASDYARLTLAGGADSVPSTPIAKAVGAVPVSAISIPDEEGSQSSSATPVLRLSIGEETVELEIDQMPVRIGRSPTNELVVPQSQANVSREHLVVHSITEAGMDIEVIGRSGVMLESTLHRKSERFNCSWGATLLLTRPRDGRPPCTLTLLRSVSSA